MFVVVKDETRRIYVRKRSVMYFRLLIAFPVQKRNKLISGPPSHMNLISG